MGFPSATLFYGFPFHTDNPHTTRPDQFNPDSPPRAPVWPPAEREPQVAYEANVGDECKVEWYGEEFCVIFALAVKASRRTVTNWDLGDSAIDLPTHEPMWDEQLRAAAERADIPWRKPGWHLVIDDT